MYFDIKFTRLAIRHTSSKPCLVNLISKDIHLVFAMYYKGTVLYLPSCISTPNVLLCCVARFKGSREIFDSDKYSISSEGDRYILTVKNAFGEDEDEYVVRASNGGGSKTSRADLEIRGRIGYKSYEPVHEISNNVVCAISKASDQPAHTRSLIRAFASRLSIL